MHLATGRLSRHPLMLLIAALPAVLGGFALAGGPLSSSAHAVTGIDTAATALQHGPVYVDPRVQSQLPKAQATALADKIKKADKPLFVAVLPANGQFPARTVLQDLRTSVGVTGVYAIHLGGGFNAGADPQVMPPNAVANLVGDVKRNDASSTGTELNAFVDRALPQASGSAPRSWSGGSNEPAGNSGAGFVSGLVVLAVVAVLAVGGGFAFRHRSRTLRARRDHAQLDRLRTVVDEDITAYGEELDRLDFSPGDPSADDAMRRDYQQALDAYESAKAKMAAARAPQDVRPVTGTLEEGRFALATLAARRAGEPLPERRPPCFFDPRHGPSVRDVVWTPVGGSPREVPACAADATRLEDGDEPMARTVETASGRQPYWNAGPMYGPWAGGYFGGGLLPGLLVGTMLGGAMASPSYGYATGDEGTGYDAGGGPDGGDYSGSDFDPGDFGGGGFGNGGDGGFGGGGGGDGGFGGGGF
ncbi:hypothetical protein POF50_031585 [Streptomyces sp. SL13]|uniref:Uncharacterized protein n=1 Tax=Streptantibioticus silvisoli TaxID=2705255 RepID=A0AA90H9P4_9ACTN|nr:hypothetical protein [Streptantibioticus silvisoli]MDI5973831.1 hypothetical protein [Streptantibioticus silvisoli]